MGEGRIPAPSRAPRPQKGGDGGGHKIFVIAYHLLLEASFHEEERYDRRLPRQEERGREGASRLWSAWTTRPWPRSLGSF